MVGKDDSFTRKDTIEKYGPCTLNEWIGMHHSDEEKSKVFLNMDMALKYIHEHDYCISNFSFDRIEVLNNSSNYIRFMDLMPLSTNPIRKKEMISEDIFYSSILQICSYLNMPVERLNIPFLKENFDEFAKNIPSGDVPYYRGVIVRRASVYLCEYALEKRNRDLANLEKELGETGKDGKSFSDENPVRLGMDSLSNDKINDFIYKKINGSGSSAFINYLLIPTIIIFTLLVFGMIAWIISLI